MYLYKVNFRLVLPDRPTERLFVQGITRILEGLNVKHFGNFDTLPTKATSFDSGFSIKQKLKSKFNFVLNLFGIIFQLFTALMKFYAVRGKL